jgi:malate/lactate dehydrogenase
VDGDVHKVKSFFTKEETDELISSIQNRGGEVIKKQGLSSGLSAAGAIVRHLGDLFAPSKGSLLTDISETSASGVNTFSAGVLSTGNPYGVPDGMVYSFPCYLHNGEIRIVPNLKLSAETTARLGVSTAELQGERVEAENFLTALPTPKL